MAKKKKAKKQRKSAESAVEETTPKRKRGRPRKEEVEEQETEKQYSWEDESSTQRGLLVIFLFGLAAISILSFVDAAGEAGEWVDRILGWLFGWGRFVTPFVFAGLGYVFLHPEAYEIKIRNYFGIMLFLLSLLALLHLVVPFEEFMDAPTAGRGGGYMGVLLAYPLVKYAGIWATIVILFGLFTSSLLIMFNMSLPALIAQVRRLGVIGGFGAWIRDKVHARVNGYRSSSDEEEVFEEEYDDVDEESDDEDVEEDVFEEREVSDAVESVQKQSEKDLEQSTFIPKEEKKKKTKKRHSKVDVPIQLLTKGGGKPTSGNIEANMEKIEKTYHSFGIDVTMEGVAVGPMVTQYAFKPADGVKLTQITTLQNDIALALAAHPIRIEAPIPGKSLVGIEVPNKSAAVVTLREMIESKEFKKRKDDLSLALGKDVAGKTFVASIAKMPHVLIAGATGSGKSVCINGLIVSLLYQHSADELKFIMVDPKRVELTLYNGIPHLLTPVITDVDKTVNALKWAVAEMDRRYELLSKVGKRNIEEYNKSVNEDQKMPYVVFIIDELADLMSVAAKSVEAAIVRLAQMSRAIGIHLVLATQRPSVNVITGLIKANMPARIAFSVTSLVDSRTILDFAGAEKLIGKGDMLYVDSQISKPKRVQGAFLSTDEIERVVNYLRENGEDPEYDSDVTEAAVGGVTGGVGGASDESDELLPQAKEVILEAGKASASMLQRRLRVGYARAARILDILEAQGFIGPADGSKPREILANTEEPEEVAAAQVAAAEAEDTDDYDDDSGDNGGGEAPAPEYDGSADDDDNDAEDDDYERV